MDYRFKYKAIILYGLLETVIINLEQRRVLIFKYKVIHTGNKHVMTVFYTSAISDSPTNDRFTRATSKR